MITASNTNGDVFKGSLPESCTIQNIGTLFQEIKEISIKYSDIEINLPKEASIDLTFIQLLISLKQSVNKLNKKFTLNYTLSEEQSDLLNITGLYNELKN